MMDQRANDDSFHADDVLQWDVDRMCAWLRQVGLKDAESYFRENKIGGVALTKMGPECVSIPKKIRNLDNNMKRKLTNYLESFVQELQEAVTGGNGRKVPPPPMSNGKPASRPPMAVPPTEDDSDEFTPDEEIYVNTAEGDDDLPPPPPPPRPVQQPPGKRPAPGAVKSPPANDGSDSPDENYEEPIVSPVSAGKGRHNPPAASRPPPAPLPPPIPPLDPDCASEDEGLYAAADETRGHSAGPRTINAPSKPAAPAPSPGRVTAKPPSNERSAPPLPSSVGRPALPQPVQQAPPTVNNPATSRPPPLPPLPTGDDSDDENYVCPENEELYEAPPENDVNDNKTKGRGRVAAPPPTPSRNPDTKVTSPQQRLPGRGSPAPSLPSRGKQNPKQVEVDETYDDPDSSFSWPAKSNARPGLNSSAPVLPPQRQPLPPPSSGLSDSADDTYEAPNECDDDRNNSHRSGSNAKESDEENYVTPGEDNDPDRFYDNYNDDAPPPLPPSGNWTRGGVPPPPAPPVTGVTCVSNAPSPITRRPSADNKPIGKPSIGSSIQGLGVGQNTLSKALGNLKKVRPSIPVDDRASAPAPPTETFVVKLKPTKNAPPVDSAQPVQPLRASPNEPERPPPVTRPVRIPLPPPALDTANSPSDKTTNLPRPPPDQPPRKPPPIKDVPAIGPQSPSSESGGGEMAATPLPPLERLDRLPPSKAQIKPPGPPPATVDSLEKRPWFFSSIDRKTAISKVEALGQNGAFLVRKSETGGVDAPYVLCVLHDGRPYNIQIRCRRADKKIALGHPKDTENVFNSVEEMISFHINNPLEVSKEGKSCGLVRLGVSPEK